MPLGIGVEQVPCGCDGRLVTDCRHDVIQRPPLGRVVMHVVGGEQRQAVFARKRIEPVDPGNVVAAIEVGGGKVAQRG